MSSLQGYYGLKLKDQKSTPEVFELADNRREADLIGIGAAVTHRPLPHHRAYGSGIGGASAKGE